MTRDPKARAARLYRRRTGWDEGIAVDMLTVNVALHDCQRAFERAIFAPFGASAGFRPDWGRAFRPLFLIAYAYCAIMVAFLLWAFITGRF